MAKAPRVDKQPAVRLPEDSDLPDLAVLGERRHVAAFTVYVDDFLAAGPGSVPQPLLSELLPLWKGSLPDLLGHDEGDIDSLRFLGLDIELGEKGTWLVHQQSYSYAFLKEMYDFDCLKERTTPAEPETFSTRPEVHANKAKPKRAVLCAAKDPLEHTPVQRLVGVGDQAVR